MSKKRKGTTGENIIVAVRVRPFNRREMRINTKNRFNIVRMVNSLVVLSDPSSRTKKEFTFDHSFWSCNPEDKHFASQERVYKTLGSPLLENAWKV